MVPLHLLIIPLRIIWLNYISFQSEVLMGMSIFNGFFCVGLAIAKIYLGKMLDSISIITDGWYSLKLVWILHIWIPRSIFLFNWYCLTFGQNWLFSNLFILYWFVHIFAQIIAMWCCICIYLYLGDISLWMYVHFFHGIYTSAVC